MIKLEALESFRLQRFNEVKNLVRAGKEEKGFINKNDTFECEKDLADYLLGANSLKKPVVKIIEVEPDIKLTHGDIIEENIISLENEEKLEELKEELEKHIEKPKKKKSSKK